MGFGGIIGKLIGGLTGNLLGGLMGQPEPKQQQQQQPYGTRNMGVSPKKPSKAGKLSLIKSSQSGVLEGGGSSSGRGKLLGN